MCCSSCAGKDGRVICTLIYKQNLLYINIFSTKRFFPNSSSSPNILMQCCVERSAWTLSCARISSSQSLCCINPPPAHVLPNLGHLSHQQPLSTLLTHAKCPGSVRDFTKMYPQMWQEVREIGDFWQ